MFIGMLTKTWKMEDLTETLEHLATLEQDYADLGSGKEERADEY